MKTASQQGAQNLAKLGIAEELQKRMKAREQRTEITQDMVLREYAKAILETRRLRLSDPIAARCSIVIFE